MCPSERLRRRSVPQDHRRCDVPRTILPHGPQYSHSTRDRRPLRGAQPRCDMVGVHVGPCAMKCLHRDRSFHGAPPRQVDFTRRAGTAARLQKSYRIPQLCGSAARSGRPECVIQISVARSEPRAQQGMGDLWPHQHKMHRVRKRHGRDIIPHLLNRRKQTSPVNLSEVFHTFRHPPTLGWGI